MDLTNFSMNPTSAHQALLRCDLNHKILITSVSLVIFSMMAWAFGEYQKVAEPTNWQTTTAVVKEIRTSELKKQGKSQLHLQVQVGSKPAFEASFPPMTPDTALAFKSDIEKSHNVDIYQRIGDNPEYTLSYSYLAYQRWVSVLVMVGGIGMLVIYGVLRSWTIGRESIKSEFRAPVLESTKPSQLVAEKFAQSRGLGGFWEPKKTKAQLENRETVINGDGSTDEQGKLTINQAAQREQHLR
ncbi:MAG: hypothetical protein SGJ27_11380 [Candidatus Melainabacteria bacterium]|nr:hypothetical protein [Candidatus Melainabacteria bacterium]